MKADGFASPWESAMKHGFVPLLSERRELYRNEREISLDVFMSSRTSGGVRVSGRFQTESSARRETIIARLTRIFNGDRHCYPSCSLNTKIYSLLRFFLKYFNTSL